MNCQKCICLIISGQLLAKIRFDSIQFINDFDHTGTALVAKPSRVKNSEIIQQVENGNYS